MASDFMTAEEVAALLRISKYTVYEMVKRGDIPASKVGRKVRINKEDIENYLQPTKETEKEQDSVNTITFDTKPIIFIGSHDISLETVLTSFNQSRKGQLIIPAFVGSMEGLLSLYYERADVVGCHLLDEESGTYNIPIIKQLFPNENMVLIHFVKRNVGWIVPKGNPKNLKDWDDLDRADLTIINRQKGAGTRVLLDYQLKKASLDKHALNGYEMEETTHYAAASVVARGSADYALGTESAAFALGLDFIPLLKEPYDLVMRESFYLSSQWKLVEEYMKSDDVNHRILALGGYEINQLGMKVEVK